MKLLLTGTPKSGKSTLLKALVDTIEVNKRGLLTLEIIGEDGLRSGFEVITSTGSKALLAQTAAKNQYPVGRFFVEPAKLDKLTINIGRPVNGEVLYIDEIGQMQLMSENFRKLVERFNSSNNDFLATTSSVYTDPLIKELLNNPKFLRLELTEENRVEINQVARVILANREVFNLATEQVQSEVLNMVSRYLLNNNYVSIKKLFSNALRYYANNVRPDVENTYIVQGKTDIHNVIFINNGEWSCDCPLANGQKPYSETAECSHYQAVRLYKKQNRS